MNRLARILLVLAALHLGSSGCSDKNPLGTTRLVVSPDSLRLELLSDSTTFTVGNSGSKPLTWTASPGAGYLTLAPSSGSLRPGDASRVTVTANRSGLATGSFTTSITIQSDAGQSAQIAVRLDNYANANWVLDHEVVDAEFSRATNRIVTVSASPPGLHVLDPVARLSWSVPLSLDPACVSVRPDGHFAAVGHAGAVSYVDLTTFAVVRLYTISADALDIVLASNGWVYIFPDGPDYILSIVHSLNLSSGLETPQSGNQIRAGLVGRLHPSGDYIYATDNGVDPPDVRKFTIQGGGAGNLYDSPYHGEYQFGRDLWISDDGTRIFMAIGSVLAVSEVMNSDMVHVAEMDGFLWARWIEQSAAAGRVLCVPGEDTFTPAPSEIVSFGWPGLEFRGTVALEPTLLDDGTPDGIMADSKGRFVFIDAPGTSAFAIVHAAPPAGPARWAIARLGVSSIP
ncbi:MAG: hypothetical protein AAB011_11025 [Candidatus Eisenbacteria bacterium]